MKIPKGTPSRPSSEEQGAQSAATDLTDALARKIAEKKSEALDSLRKATEKHEIVAKELREAKFLFQGADDAHQAAMLKLAQAKTEIKAGDGKTDPRAMNSIIDTKQKDAENAKKFVDELKGRLVELWDKVKLAERTVEEARSNPNLASDKAEDAPEAASAKRPAGIEFSLVCFGGVIGFMTVLSEHAGTTITLIGLLFAMVGGSLTSHFSTQTMTSETRSWIFRVAGVVSLGIILGLLLGFLLQQTDRQFLAPKRVQQDIELLKQLKLAGIEIGPLKPTSISDIVPTLRERADKIQLQNALNTGADDELLNLIDNAKKNDKHSKLVKSLERYKSWLEYNQNLSIEVTDLKKELGEAGKGPNPIDVGSFNAELSGLQKQINENSK